MGLIIQSLQIPTIVFLIYILICGPSNQCEKQSHAVPCSDCPHKTITSTLLTYGSVNYSECTFTACISAHVTTCLWGRSAVVWTASRCTIRERHLFLKFWWTHWCLTRLRMWNRSFFFLLLLLFLLFEFTTAESLPHVIPWGVLTERVCVDDCRKNTCMC